MYTNTSVLCENLSEKEQSQKLEFYRLVGYQVLFINFEYNQNKDYMSLLSDTQALTPLELHGKITLYPKDVKHLKNELRTLKNAKQFFTSVQSTNKDVLTFAVNDSRVDALSFPRISNLKFITPGIVSLVKTNHNFIEISLRDAILAKPNERSRTFHELDKFLKIMNTSMNSVIYGGWEESTFEIVGPHEIISIFTALFDIPEKICSSFLKTNPQKVRLHIDERENPFHIQQGVKILPDSKKGD